MNITFSDKIKMILKIYIISYKLPWFKVILSILLNPMDSTRYNEFTYILKFIKKENIKLNEILDISSPYILSYILSNQAKVIKIDINENEKYYINNSEKLTFLKENATQLTFNDSSFDMIYSISVIEHIYNNYISAIKEMIRVCKNWWYIYLTFPVSKNWMEEWLDNDIYSDQYTNNNKTFFQYRFNEKQIKEIENIWNLEIICKDIFWETNLFKYDTLIKLLKYNTINKYLTFMKNSIINFIYWLWIFSKSENDFKNAKKFWNIHYIFKVKK